MIVRIKKRKNKAGEELSYAYLVENKWTSKGPRQRVKGYLGKVCFLKGNDAVFDSDIKDRSYRESIGDLIKWEFRKHGFKENKGFFFFDDIFVSVENNEIYKKTKNKKIKCTLALNEGFLCDFTIKRLMEFNEKGSEKEVGLKLAKCFVEAGIDVPKDVFIECFEKAYGR